MHWMLVIFLVIGSAAARAQQAPLVFSAPSPAPAAPDDWIALAWLFNDIRTEGYWYSAAKVQRISTRLDYLENKATQECIAATNAATKADLGSPAAWWLAAGLGLIAGSIGGYFIARKVR